MQMELHRNYLQLQLITMTKNYAGACAGKRTVESMSKADRKEDGELDDKDGK